MSLVVSMTLVPMREDMCLMREEMRLMRGETAALRRDMNDEFKAVRADMANSPNA